MAEGSCDLLIFDSRLIWQNVSNAADKFTATQIVRSGGFLWLNPIAISVVICSRAEVVEWSGLKLCRSGAGWRYLLIVSRIRDSSTLAAGKKSDSPIRSSYGGVLARFRYWDDQWRLPYRRNLRSRDWEVKGSRARGCSWYVKKFFVRKDVLYLRKLYSS